MRVRARQGERVHADDSCSIKVSKGTSLIDRFKAVTTLFLSLLLVLLLLPSTIPLLHPSNSSFTPFSSSSLPIPFHSVPQTLFKPPHLLPSTFFPPPPPPFSTLKFLFVCPMAGMKRLGSAKCIRGRREEEVVLVYFHTVTLVLNRDYCIFIVTEAIGNHRKKLLS